MVILDDIIMRFRLQMVAFGCLSLVLSITSNLQSEEMEDMSVSDQLNLAMPTMGGKQFWADELFFHKWRIQRNVFTGHYRLLDDQDRRHASGTYDQCLETLNDIKIKQHLPPMKGKAVIVLHGLFRSRNSMDSLCDYLAEHGQYEVFNVAYPSTQDDIGEHARSLAHIIDNLDGIEEINFVGHSLGNIVIRHYLGDLQRQEAQKHRTSDRPDTISPDKRPKFGRFVMLGPPNHEARMATAFADNIIFKTVSGQSGQQLGRNWKELESQLAVPDFEFAIIAGGKNSDKGYNPWLAGDNDGTVSVESTKLSGARDFLVVPVLHTFMVNNAQVEELTLRFLRHGYLKSEEQRHPLDN
jgi:pimeloyl-ACP methyl ester carboxylesterase